MAAPTNYYVRPVNGNDTTGNGLSHATAWKTVQKALNTIVRNATDGDQINVCSEGTDVLSASLSFATYGNGSLAAPLIIRGYTTTAGDGGQGQISGGGSVSVVGTTNVGGCVRFVDMKLFNCGSANVVNYTGAWLNYYYNCEISNSTGHGINTRNPFVARCYFHDLANGLNGFVSNFHCYDSFFKDCSGYAIAGQSPPGVLKRNIIKCSGSAGGIFVWGNDYVIEGNTIWSSGGTGGGIVWRNGDTVEILTNNIIVGFSGVGGAAIRQVTNADQIFQYGYNLFYNNTANLVQVGDVFWNMGNNTVLGSDPFVDAANDNFAISSALKGLGYPATFLNGHAQYLDPGAAQREEEAGLAWPIFSSMIRAGVPFS